MSSFQGPPYVAHRLEHPQPHQTLDEDRLYCNLLSSMPMCFNLFGELWADLALADKAVHTWWPDTPGTVSAVEFEWSPGRSRKGEYLENRSAFDVAFILDLGNGKKGVVGVETKYHEHATRMKQPSAERAERYRQVAEESGVFGKGTVEKIVGTELEQILLDHLLALSMPMKPTAGWTWARFAVVYPEANPSFRRAAQDYREFAGNTDTFKVSTVESLIDSDALPIVSPELAANRHCRNHSQMGRRLEELSRFESSATVPNITKTHRGVVWVGPIVTEQYGVPNRLAHAVQEANLGVLSCVPWKSREGLHRHSQLRSRSVISS